MPKNTLKPAVVRPQSKRPQPEEVTYRLGYSARYEKAFTYNPGEVVAGVVKGILSISHLLVSLSEHGNEPIEGWTAYGLASALQKYAKDVDHFLQPRMPGVRTTFSERQRS